MLSRVVLTSSGSDPKRLVLDAPTNHPGVESRTSASDSPKTRASTVSTVSEVRVVDTLTHSLIGTQARVADSRMTLTVLGRKVSSKCSRTKGSLFGNAKVKSTPLILK